MALALNLFFYFCVFSTCAKKLDLLSDNIRIKNFELSQCNSNIHDPITFKDVNVDFGATGNLLASGTMINDVNLTVPITVSILYQIICSSKFMKILG